jgi:hypothetical protein
MNTPSLFRHRNRASTSRWSANASLSEVLRTLSVIAGQGRSSEDSRGLVTVRISRATRPAPAARAYRVSRPRPIAEQIDTLYREVGKLLALAPGDPARRAVGDLLTRLRELQSEEAERLQERFVSGLQLAPGTGLKALQEARDLLADNDDPAPSHRPLDAPD